MRAPTSPVTTGRLPVWLIYAVASLTLMVLLGVVFYPSPKSDARSAADTQSSLAPVGQTPWDQLWSKALAQPVLGCREAPGARTFMSCACPDATTPAAAAQCQPEPGWPGHRLIGALQAVLRVGHPDDVWVDWEPGPELSQALQHLPCKLTDAAKAARTALDNASGAEGRATGDAALQLLDYLQQDPSCAA